MAPIVASPPPILVARNPPDVCPPRDLFFSAWITLAALLPRLYVALAWGREPVWDGHYYDFGARRIAHGFGYSDGLSRWHPWCHWPVGYSALLAGAYRIFGDGLEVSGVLNSVIGALVVFFTHRLARYALPSGRARLAALLCAAYPGLILYSALVMTEPLSALIALIAGWIGVREGEAGRHMRGAAMAGFVLGLGTLVRPTFIALAPAIFLLMPPRNDRPAQRWRPLLANLRVGGFATLCALLIVAPWTYRNCRVMDGCTFVSTNGGWNLAIGAFPRATGRFETLRTTDGCTVVTGQVQQDRCFRDLAIHAIAADPLRWLRLIPRKLGYTFDQESFPIEYLHEADPDRWPEGRRSKGRSVLTGANRALLLASLLGLVQLPMCQMSKRLRVPQRNWLFSIAAHGALASFVIALAIHTYRSDASPYYQLPLALAVLAPWRLPSATVRPPALRWGHVCLLLTVITHALFFGEDRYHLTITPMLCIWALSAVSFGIKKERGPNEGH